MNSGKRMMEAMGHIDPELVELAQAPIQKRRPKLWVAAAIAACLVLGTAMAWGMAGFGPLADLLGRESEQLLPYYQPIGETVKVTGGTVKVEGVVATTGSCTVLYKVKLEGLDKQDPDFDMLNFHSDLLRMDQPDENSFYGEGAGKRVTGGYSYTWLDSEEPDTVYHLEMKKLKEPLEPGAPYELWIHFWDEEDSPPSRTLSIPVEEVFEEIKIETPESKHFASISLSPALFHGQAIVSGPRRDPKLPFLEPNPDLTLVYTDGSRWTMGEEQLLYGKGRMGLFWTAEEDGYPRMTWNLKEAPPNLENLAGIELDGVYYPAE